MSEIDLFKQRVISKVEEYQDKLIVMADRIHANPELAFQEHEAAMLLSGTLEQAGFAVERGVAGLETAFVATLEGQPGGPALALLAEYDALAGLGHACGHNLIGTAAVGAGLALQAVLPELAGTVQVIGTPAEEGGGGKVIMVEAGVFEGVDVAMMIHPSNQNLIGRLSLTAYPVRIEFFGRAAHAAGSPDQGINALSALLQTFSSIDALRLHLRDDARVHGIITEGGQAANIIPDYAEAKFSVRALDMSYATEVLDRVRACAEGAALATGARVNVEVCGPRYDARIPNPTLVELFRANMGTLGIEMDLATGQERMGSSDIGNVSQVVPAIHPYLSIGSEDLVGHTPEFCQAAASPAGHEAMLNGAKAMAMTVVDLLADPAAMDQVRQTFERTVRSKSEQD